MIMKGQIHRRYEENPCEKESVTVEKKIILVRGYKPWTNAFIACASTCHLIRICPATI